MADIKQHREAVVAAHNALELLLEWDKSRDFIVPYKVRDPIHAAMRQLRAVLSNAGVSVPPPSVPDGAIQAAPKEPGR